jgi:hypothetical protein
MFTTGILDTKMNFNISVSDLDFISAFHLYFTILFFSCHLEHLYSSEQYNGHHNDCIYSHI